MKKFCNLLLCRSTFGDQEEEEEEESEGGEGRGGRERAFRMLTRRKSGRGLGSLR